ncbi:hypothetical protein KAR48_20945, partial [bacterium]|nr:hypothetical protein [bacterium]
FKNSALSEHDTRNHPVNPVILSCSFLMLSSVLWINNVTPACCANLRICGFITLLKTIPKMTQISAEYMLWTSL